MTTFRLTIRVEGEAFRNSDLHDELLSCLARVSDALARGMYDGTVYSSANELVGEWSIGGEEQ